MDGRIAWVAGTTLILAVIGGPVMADGTVTSLAEPEAVNVIGLSIPATLSVFGVGVIAAFAARKLLVKRK